jgi:hypothetical protein
MQRHDVVLRVCDATGRERSRVVWARPKTGGHDEFDFDESELLELERPIEAPKPKAAATSRAALGKATQQSGVHVFPIDRIAELKRKIYLATDIPPFRQHLWATGAPEQPLAYTIGDEYRPQMLINILDDDGTVQFNGLPVTNWIEYKESLQVVARDEFVLVGDVRDFSVVDLNEYVDPIRATLESMIKDTYSMEMIYWGFIVRFWPMLSSSMFTEYLRDESSIAAQYPALAPPLDELKVSLAAESAILTKPIKAAGALAPALVNGAALGVAILRSEITCAATTTVVYLRNVFDALRLTPEMPYVAALLEHDMRTVLLTKTYKTFVSPPNGVSRPRMNTMQILLGRSTLLRVSANGTYSVASIWQENMRMDFAHVFAAVSEVINPIIAASFGGPVDDVPMCAAGLAPMTVDNSRFSGINASIFWKFPVSSRDTGRAIGSFINAGLFTRTASANAAAQEFIFTKGMTKYNTTHMRTNYSYMSDATAATRMATVRRQKHMLISHRFSDVRIDITNLWEREFTHFMDVIIRLIEAFPRTKSREHDTARKLKQLKEKDPVLYEMRKIYGVDDDSYGRKCQQPKQPIMHHDPGKGRVKYWNFTTNEPVYYGCPSAKYPYIMFRTGIHPRGFCMPCCYKLPPPSDGVRADVYNTCLADHQYTGKKKSVAARNDYVVAYGKDVEPGRRSRLPEETLEPLFYNSSDKSDKECADRDGFYLFGVRQHVSNVNDIGVLFSISHALGKPIHTFARETIVRMRARPSTWSTLLGGTICDYYATADDLAAELSAVFVGTKESDATYWNALWMEMTIMWWDVHVVHFRDRGSGKNNIMLVVPPYVTHWEEYVSKLPYVVLIERANIWGPVYGYSRTGDRVTRMHVNPSSIVSEVDNIVRYSLPGSEYYVFDLHVVSTYVRNGVDGGRSIQRLYINSANRCYGMIVDGFYLPVLESYYELENVPLSYEAPTPEQAPTWKVLSAFIAGFNTWVGTYAAANGTRDRATVTPVTWLRRDGAYCGFATTDLTFMFQPDEVAGTAAGAAVRDLLYDPYEVNAAIAAATPPVRDDRATQLYDAMYDLHLYEMMVIQLSSMIAKKPSLLGTLRKTGDAALPARLGSIIRIPRRGARGDDETFPNVLVPVSSGDAPPAELLEILAADIKNPLKARMWIPTFGVLDYYRFAKRRGEQIVVEFI